VETANVNDFSSTKSLKQMAESSNERPKPLTHVQLGPLVRQVSQYGVMYEHALEHQTKWHWQVHCAPQERASLLRTDYLYSSAWSYKTGKRMEVIL
jgi:hypothetical protein